MLNVTGRVRVDCVEVPSGDSDDDCPKHARWSPEPDLHKGCLPGREQLDCLHDYEHCRLGALYSAFLIIAIYSKRFLPGFSASLDYQCVPKQCSLEVEHGDLTLLNDTSKSPDRGYSAQVAEEL